MYNAQTAVPSGVWSAGWRSDLVVDEAPEVDNKEILDVRDLVHWWPTCQ